MQKALAIISQHPELSKFSDELSTLEAYHSQRREFIKKQAQDLQTEFESKQAALTSGIVEFLKEKKMMPADYDTEKHHVHADLETGVVFYCDNESKEHPMAQFLRSIGAFRIDS